MKPDWRCAIAVVFALLIAGCSGGSNDEVDEPAENIDGPAEPLRIRVVISPNPAAADPDAALELRTASPEEEPEVVYEQLLSLPARNAEIDVHSADGLDVLIAGRHAVSIPRHFWEDRSSGRLVVRVQPGGIELTRRVEPTGGGRTCFENAKGKTCWSTERWFFEVPLWDIAETAAVKVVVNLRGLESEGLVPVRLHADDTTGPVLAETSTAEKKWETMVRIDTDSALVVVADDLQVVLPPDLWQLTWKTVRVEFTSEAATYNYQRPTTPRRVDQVSEPLPIERNSPEGSS